MATNNEKMIQLIVQKFKSLKSQIEYLHVNVNAQAISHKNAELRLQHVTKLLYNYEELHEELSILQPDHENLEKLTALQNTFYDTAAVINSMTTAATPADNSYTTSKFEIPRFDGNLDSWFRFKYDFLALIDARTDISDSVKLMYLRCSLDHAVVYHILKYGINDQNYKRAWNVIVSEYEKKTLLANNYLDGILVLASKDNLGPKDLSTVRSKLQFHLSMLEHLDIHPDHHIIIRMLERALSFDLRCKWESRMKLDQMPTLNEFYNFLSENAFVKSTSEDKICPACDETGHPIYRCTKFKSMPVARRWKIVKDASMCKVCLGIHDNKCTFKLCPLCSQRHNKLLHDPKQHAQQKGIKREREDDDKTTINLLPA